MRWQHAAGVAVLIVHALLIALTPTALLMLAVDDDMIVGPVTPQQWQDHLLHHLQQARDYLNGNMTPHPRDEASVGSNIISALPGSTDVLSTLGLAMGVLPYSRAAVSALQPTRDRLIYPHSLDRSPVLGVPHLPPRASLTLNVR